jgi:hypothetical protein
MMVNLVPVVILSPQPEGPEYVCPPVKVWSHGLVDESRGRTVKLWGPRPTVSWYEIWKSSSHMAVEPETVKVKSWAWETTSSKQPELGPIPEIWICVGLTPPESSAEHALPENRDVTYRRNRSSPA